LEGKMGFVLYPLCTRVHVIFHSCILGVRDDCYSAQLVQT
jgi:hypothetical protein